MGDLCGGAGGAGRRVRADASGRGAAAPGGYGKEGYEEGRRRERIYNEIRGGARENESGLGERASTEVGASEARREAREGRENGKRKGERDREQERGEGGKS